MEATNQFKILKKAKVSPIEPAAPIERAATLRVHAAATASIVAAVGQIRSSDGRIRAPSPLLVESEPRSRSSVYLGASKMLALGERE